MRNRFKQQVNPICFLSVLFMNGCDPEQKMFNSFIEYIFEAISNSKAVENKHALVIALYPTV